MAMKKLLTTLLVLSVSAAFLTACGDSDGSGSSDTDASSGFNAITNDFSDNGGSNNGSTDTESATNVSDSSDGDTDTSDNDNQSYADGESSEDDAADDYQPMYEKLIADILKNGGFCEYHYDTSGEITFCYTSDFESFYTQADNNGLFAAASICTLITKDGTYEFGDIDGLGKRYYDFGANEIDRQNCIELCLAELNSYTFLDVTTETIDGTEYTVEMYSTVYHVDYKDSYNNQFSLDVDDKVKFAFNDSGEVCYRSMTDNSDFGNGEFTDYIPFAMIAQADTSKLSLDTYLNDGYTLMTWEEYTDIYF